VAANLATCGMTEAATVVAAPAERALADWARDGTRFDLALLDPPYDFDDWGGLLASLPAELAVAEAARSVEPAPGWEVVRDKRYGRTHVTILQRT
jgi:16S rRNA (guanine966-N2)-methyltransferase